MSTFTNEEMRKMAMDVIKEKEKENRVKVGATCGKCSRKKGPGETFYTVAGIPACSIPCKWDLEKSLGICSHHWYFTGNMPCTGVERCHKCGVRRDHVEEN